MKRSGWIDTDLLEGQFSGTRASKCKVLDNAKDARLWCERYRPVKVADLAVHTKKVQEVRRWLELNALLPASRNSRPRLLLLSGPAGCGKTALISTLCRELSLQIHEWVNPAAHEFEQWPDGSGSAGCDMVPFVSQSAAFEQFLLRAKRYRVLEGLECSGEEASRGKIVLIEDLPPFALKMPDRFKDIISRFSRTSSPFPLICIHSACANDKDDVFSTRLIADLDMDHIQMNSVAPTAVVKTLSAIARAEAAISGCPTPDKDALTSLAASSGGDLRAAINALQFACLNGRRTMSVEMFTGRKSLRPSGGSSTKARKARTAPRAPQPDEDSCAIGGRNTYLDLFHAIGKVLYCKRHHDRPTDACLMSASLAPEARRELQFDPEQLLSLLPLGQEAFVSFLHQNYVDFFEDVLSLAKAADSLSRAEPFFHEWTTCGKIDLKNYGGSLAVRGLCHANADQKRNLGLRNFRKPEYYDVVKKRQSRLECVMRHSPQLGLDLGRADLFTTFLPSLAHVWPDTLAFDLLQIGLFTKGSHCTVAAKPRVPPAQALNADEQQDFFIEEVD